MKRLPLVASFLLFVLLCASLAYWGMQLFKPPVRPVAAPPRAAKADVRPEAAATLLGGRTANVAAASNYQLKGVIFSGSTKDSVAILSADGKPAQAFRVGTEISPGVSVKEVHRGFVLISDNGATKRVELPEQTGTQVNVANTSPTPVRAATPPPRTPTPTPSAPPQTRAQAAASGNVPPSSPVSPAASMPTQPIPPQMPMQPPPSATQPAQPAPPAQVANVPGVPVPVPGQPGVAPPPSTFVNPPPTTPPVAPQANPAAAVQAPQAQPPAFAPPSAPPPQPAPIGTRSASDPPLISR